MTVETLRELSPQDGERIRRCASLIAELLMMSNLSDENRVLVASTAVEVMLNMIADKAQRQKMLELHQAVIRAIVRFDA